MSGSMAMRRQILLKDTNNADQAGTDASYDSISHSPTMQTLSATKAEGFSAGGRCDSPVSPIIVSPRGQGGRARAGSASLDSPLSIVTGRKRHWSDTPELNIDVRASANGGGGKSADPSHEVASPVPTKGDDAVIGTPSFTPAGGSVNQTFMTDVIEDELEEQIGIDRISLRLDGLEMYALITSLTAGFSFAGLEMVSVEEMENAGFLVSLLFTTTVLLSILCGLYSTIVFALCSLYAKTALGSSRDAEMSEFLDKTGPHRRRGFNHFLYSLGAFASNVLLIAYLKLPPRLGYPMLGLGGYLLYIGRRDINEIISLAGPIFAPPKPHAHATPNTQEGGGGGAAGGRGVAGGFGSSHKQMTPTPATPTAAPTLASPPAATATSVGGVKIEACVESEGKKEA